MAEHDGHGKHTRSPLGAKSGAGLESIIIRLLD